MLDKENFSTKQGQAKLSNPLLLILLSTALEKIFQVPIEKMVGFTEDIIILPTSTEQEEIPKKVKKLQITLKSSWEIIKNYVKYF